VRADPSAHQTGKLAKVVVGLLAAAVAVAGCTSPAATHAKPAHPAAAHDHSRPNFIVVLTDHLSWNLVSHMPHLLAMERAGTTMSRYYVVDSLCDTATDPYELDNLAGKGVPEVLRQGLSALATCRGGAACWAAAQLG
jgi:hypothetical protein